jgi:hypothetical protein
LILKSWIRQQTVKGAVAGGLDGGADPPLAQALKKTGGKPGLHAVAESSDEVLFDFKIMDPELARSLLRMNQPRVLDNFGIRLMFLVASWRKLSSTRG